jgi:hypothetical protein
VPFPMAGVSGIDRFVLRDGLVLVDGASLRARDVATVGMHRTRGNAKLARKSASTLWNLSRGVVLYKPRFVRMRSRVPRRYRLRSRAFGIHANLLRSFRNDRVAESGDGRTMLPAVTTASYEMPTCTAVQTSKNTEIRVSHLELHQRNLPALPLVGSPGSFAHILCHMIDGALRALELGLDARRRLRDRPSP